MAMDKLLRQFIRRYEKDLKTLGVLFKEISRMENATTTSKFESLIAKEAISMTTTISRMKEVLEDQGQTKPKQTVRAANT